MTKVIVTLSQRAAPIYGGQKCPKWAILAEIFSRSPLVLIPFFSRSSLVNEKYPHIWTGIVRSNSDAYLFYRSETGCNEFESRWVATKNLLRRHVNCLTVFADEGLAKTSSKPNPNTPSHRATKHYFGWA